MTVGVGSAVVVATLLLELGAVVLAGGAALVLGATEVDSGVLLGADFSELQLATNKLTARAPAASREVGRIFTGSP